MKRQKDMTLKDELPKSVGAQYAPGEEQRNISRRNEEAEPKQKQHAAVDVSSEPHFVRTLHHDLSILSGPTRHGL